METPSNTEVGRFVEVIIAHRDGIEEQVTSKEVMLKLGEQSGRFYVEAKDTLSEERRAVVTSVLCKNDLSYDPTVDQENFAPLIETFAVLQSLRSMEPDHTDLFRKCSSLLNVNVEKLGLGSLRIGEGGSTIDTEFPQFAKVQQALVDGSAEAVAERNEKYGHLDAEGLATMLQKQLKKGLVINTGPDVWRNIIEKRVSLYLDDQEWDNSDAIEIKDSVETHSTEIQEKRGIISPKVSVNLEKLRSSLRHVKTDIPLDTEAELAKKKAAAKAIKLLTELTLICKSIKDIPDQFFSDVQDLQKTESPGDQLRKIITNCCPPEDSPTVPAYSELKAIAKMLAPFSQEGRNILCTYLYVKYSPWARIKTGLFHYTDTKYTIKINKEPKQILITLTDTYMENENGDEAVDVTINYTGNPETGEWEKVTVELDEPRKVEKKPIETEKEKTALEDKSPKLSERKKKAFSLRLGRNKSFSSLSPRRKRSSTLRGTKGERSIGSPRISRSKSVTEVKEKK